VWGYGHTASHGAHRRSFASQTPKHGLLANRLARWTRDLLFALPAITEKRKAGFRSLGDAWAGTTTAHTGG